MRLAAFLLCLPLFARDLARIEGRVIDSEGKPVANATVMTGPMTTREPSTLRTAADGTFASTA